MLSRPSLTLELPTTEQPKTIGLSHRKCRLQLCHVGTNDKTQYQESYLSVGLKVL